MPQENKWRVTRYGQANDIRQMSLTAENGAEIVLDRTYRNTWHLTVGEFEADFAVEDKDATWENAQQMAIKTIQMAAEIANQEMQAKSDKRRRNELPKKYELKWKAVSCENVKDGQEPTVMTCDITENIRLTLWRQGRYLWKIGYKDVKVEFSLPSTWEDAQKKAVDVLETNLKNRIDEYSTLIEILGR